MVKKTAVVPVQNNSQILLSFVSGSKAGKQMIFSNRSQFGKYFFACSHLQNGNCGSHSDFSSDRLVGSFYRPHQRLFSCPHTSKVSKIPTLS